MVNLSKNPTRNVESRHPYILLRGLDLPTYVLVQYISKVSPIFAGLILSVTGVIFILLARGLGVLDTKPGILIGYLQNLSWSFSMLVLFPLITVSIAHYYNLIPRLIDKLFLDHETEISKDFRERVTKHFNNPYYWLLVFSIILSLQYVYFDDLTSGNAWIWRQDGKCPERGVVLDCLNPLGWTAAFVQLVLAFIFSTFLFRAISLAACLTSLFADKEYAANIVPLHPDGVSGLGHVRQIIVSANLVLFLLGMYVSLYLFDKIWIQHVMGQQLTVVFLFTCILLLLGPVLLLYSMNAVRGRMVKAKQQFLHPLGERIRAETAKLGNLRMAPRKEDVERLSELRKNYNDLSREIAELPLDLKTARDFFQGVILAFAPFIVTLASQLLNWIMSR